jgi:DNA polymerase-1
MWHNIIAKCENGVHLINVQLNDYFASLGKSRNLYGDSAININSNKQLAEIFTELGVVTESLGKKELAKINHPLAKLLCDYKKYAKQLSSFGNSFLEFVRKSTSRVHPSFNQIGADTGRFSCTNPNLQQIPSATIDPEYRKCFRAPTGRKIVTCDYSQQELRLLASLSGDAKFIKFYEDGVDLHSATASMMFNIPIEKVEKETHRKVAKTINFGLAYGQGAKKLGETIGASEEEAAAMIEKYFSQFTFIRDWLGAAAENAQKLGYSKTLLGRKRFYRVPEQHDKEYKQVLSKIGRMGKNSPIQGSGADMVKIALVLIDNRLQAAGLDAYLINTVHDEIVVEASEQDAEKALEILRDSMVDAGKQLAANVPILAEGGVGDYWSH